MNIDDKKIKWLIYDYFAKLKAYGYTDGQSNISRNIQNIARQYNQYGYFIESFDTLYNYLMSKLMVLPHKNPPVVLFCSAKYFDIITGIKNQLFIELIAVGLKDRLHCIRNFMPYISIFKSYKFLNMYLVENNNTHLNNLFGHMEKKLKIPNSNFVVLVNDSFAIERSIILVCRKLSITTIVIQHGLYQAGNLLSDGLAADYILVWGQYFKDMYVKQGIRKDEEVYVLGYPYKIEESINLNKSNKYVVYYLGQNFEKKSVADLDVKLNTLNQIDKICSNLGMQFYYRPHPGDERKMLQEKLTHINFTPKRETLAQTIMKADILISFNSTSLIEASIRSKFCIQLMNYPYPCDNFEELGVCSKSMENIDDLEDYLDSIVKSNDLDIKQPFNNEYVDMTKNPSESFIDILKDIEKNAVMEEQKYDKNNSR